MKIGNTFSKMPYLNPRTAYVTNAMLLAIATTRSNTIVFMKNVMNTSAEATHAANSISTFVPSDTRVRSTIQSSSGGGKFGVGRDNRP